MILIALNMDDDPRFALIGTLLGPEQVIVGIIQTIIRRAES